jgi:hypothetical protein
MAMDYSSSIFLELKNMTNHAFYKQFEIYKIWVDLVLRIFSNTSKITLVSLDEFG